MNRNVLLRVIAVLIAATFWGVVATFRDFFLFNPLEGATPLRQIQLIMSTLGWIALSTGAPLLLWAISSGHRAAHRLLPLAGLLWPVGVLSTQLTLYFQDHVWYFGYLKTYPIFLVTEIVLPCLVMFLWTQLKAEPAEVAEIAE
ncbi:MAG: hypothetical protein RL410_1357 [Actinomycetota bacterium]|jgi:hypothetical protein